MASEVQRYRPEQVREIIRRAQRRPEAQDSEGLTRTELLETAREVGLDEGQVAAALAEFDEDQRLEAAQRELRQLAYRRVSGHLLWFLICNGLLAALNLSLGGPLWFLAPLCLWSVIFLVHLRGALFPDPDRQREQARKRLARQELAESGRALGEAMSRGAARLMSATARRLDDAGRGRG